MEKQQLIDYIMNSPENTNLAILNQMIDEVSSGDTPISNNACIIEVINDDETPFSPDTFNTIAKSIILPSNITSIDEGAFNGYLSLENITIPEGITTIGEEAFYGCPSLESITFPASITNIGSMVLGTSCTSITMLGTVPPTIAELPFEDATDLIIYVPIESVDVYKEAVNWSTYRDYIQPISNN